MNASTSQTELPVPLTELLEEYFRHQAQFSSSSFMVNRLAGDGSDRIYYRVQPADGSKSLIAVKAVHGRDKSCQSPQGLTITENHSFMLLAQHLAGLGFPVPGVLLSSLDCCYYLLEDLGDCTLYDLVDRRGWSPEVISCYRQALELLICIQQQAGKDLNPDWCYNGGYYDRELIISRELEYFLYSFALPLGKANVSDGDRQELSREFNRLAELKRIIATPR
jgi:aminoglycoside/choline kinase family phosphotransferase